MKQNKNEDKVKFDITITVPMMTVVNKEEKIFFSIRDGLFRSM
jgi:hypothetical protein